MLDSAYNRTSHAAPNLDEMSHFTQEWKDVMAPCETFDDSGFLLKLRSFFH